MVQGRRLLALAAVLSVLLWGCAKVEAPKTAPVLSGTFLQIDASMAAWPPDEWGRELDWMREAGLELIVVQYAGYGDAWWYPSSFAPGAPDLIGRLLHLAAERGMHVFLGLHLDPAYWSGGYDLEADLERNMRVAQELTERYAAHEAFAGWYIPHEISDWTFRDGAQFAAAVDYGRRLAAHLRSLTPGRPVSIAPYYSRYLSESGYQRRWEEFLDQVPVDIIMLQDGVGTHRVGIGDIVPHFRALRRAIGERPIQLWADVEIFDQTHGWPVDDLPWAATTAPLERIVQQMQAAAPYVDRFVAFEFSHYMSPRRPQGAELYAAYRDYREANAAEIMSPGAAHEGEPPAGAAGAGTAVSPKE